MKLSNLFKLTQLSNQKQELNPDILIMESEVLLHSYSITLKFQRKLKWLFMKKKAGG